MSVSDEDENEMELTPDETKKVRRRTHAGPWRSKQEFDSVFEWIYGENATRQSKEKACQRMIIWKLRRQNLTPGTILSTLLVLQAQLKDDVADKEAVANDKEAVAIMCTIYSSALTRFLNFMSAIAQTKDIKTMYATARALNLEPFMVDLRHLCAHGHNMPSIDVFRRASNYCLTWLRDFYWENQKQTMIDVDAKNIRKKDSTYFDENVREMFLVYDAANEALAKGCLSIPAIKKHLTAERRKVLKNFATKENVETLADASRLALKRISFLVKHGARLKDLSQIFIGALLELSYFFEAGHDVQTKSDEKSLVAQYQDLFRALALNGFIEEVYHSLVDIAENEFENVIRRKGSSFWAKQIVIGFIAFKRIKMVYKRQLEEKSKKKLSLSSINETNVSDKVLGAYEELDLDVHGILIFGDTAKCPWALSFSRQYVMERIARLNEYTIDVIKCCLQLIEPVLSEKESIKLTHLIDVYVGDTIDMDIENNRSSRVFTLQGDILKNKLDDVEMSETDSKLTSTKKQFGIWSQVSDGQEWYSSPLGRLMWE